MAGVDEFSDLSAEHRSMAQYVRRQLGFPVVKVELCKENFLDAIVEAELWFLSHIGATKVADIQVSPGVVEYDVVPEAVSVVDFIPPQFEPRLSPLTSPYLFGDFDAIPSGYWDLRRGGGGILSGLTQVTQFSDMLQRTLATDLDWWWDRERRKLVIQSINRSGIGRYTYMTAQIDYSALQPFEFRLIRRYAVAQAKLQLGTIRSKFSDVALPGGRVSLNGQDLIANAQEELQVLNEEVQSWNMPVGIIRG